MYTLLISFAAVAILFSFLCSMWEAVLLSVTPSYAQVKLQEGTALGRHLQAFKENIDRPLAAILTLNTIAHTVGAIGVGNEAAAIWSETNPMLTAVVIPVVMTLAILILSEIIPKTLGANYWQELAPFTVSSLRLVMKLLAPLVWLSQLITGVLKKDKQSSVFSRTDFVAMATLGAEQGVIKEDESQIISNLLRFHHVRARDVMTPRTVVVAAPAEQTIEAFHAEHPDLRFSRIPLYQGGDKDQVNGFVLRSEVLAALVRDEGDTKLETLRREMMVLREDVDVPRVLDRLVTERSHIAVVVDEFGGMSGIVTIEDIVETLLGLEIVDELDHAEDMQALARRNWERRAQRMGLIEPSPDEASEADESGANGSKEPPQP